MPGLRSPGIERVLLVSSRGAWLLRHNGKRRRAGRVFVDRAARSFVVRMRRTALPPRRTSRLRLAAGLANDAGDGFAPVGSNLGARSGQPPVYNLAFRRPPGDAAQQPVDGGRAGRGPDERRRLAPFSALIRWSALARDRDHARAAAERLREPLVRHLDRARPGRRAGRGAGTGDLKPNFLGRVQPYGVYVPSAHDPRSAPARLDPALARRAAQPVRSAQPEARRARCASANARSAPRRSAAARTAGTWTRPSSTSSRSGARSPAPYRLDPRAHGHLRLLDGRLRRLPAGLGYPDLFSQAHLARGPTRARPAVLPRLRRQRGQPPGGHDRDGRERPLAPFLIEHGAADQLVPVTSVVEHVDQFDGSATATASSSTRPRTTSSGRRRTASTPRSTRSTAPRGPPRPAT